MTIGRRVLNRERSVDGRHAWAAGRARYVLAKFSYSNLIMRSCVPVNRDITLECRFNTRLGDVMDNAGKIRLEMREMRFAPALSKTIGSSCVMWQNRRMAKQTALILSGCRGKGTQAKYSSKYSECHLYDRRNQFSGNIRLDKYPHWPHPVHKTDKTME